MIKSVKKYGAMFTCKAQCEMSSIVICQQTFTMSHRFYLSHSDMFPIIAVF